jgi:dolichyl-phosphate-mannose-protein mannosyltransferase
LKRFVVVIPALLFAAGLALYTPRLAVPGDYIFDEVYHAYTAGQYAAGNADAYVWYTKSPRHGVAYMWNHPPVGVHLIELGIRLWGDDSYGWRFMSAVFGALGLVLVYRLAIALTGRLGVSLLAAGLLMMDGLYFVQSRTGMLDVFGVVFMMGALLAFHRYWTTPADRAGPWLAVVGLLLGLAVATKWNAAYASAMVGVAAIARSLWSARRDATPRTSPLGGLAWTLLGLVLIPAIVYMLAYVPFFLSGHSLKELIELQRQIYVYHSRLTATHLYQSSWWQWPLVLRPVWYHVHHTPGHVANIYALANPILQWMLLPAVLWLSVVWARRRDPALITLLIGFFGQWLPWALVSRISFAYHFLPVVPFGCVALAVAMARIAEGPPRLRWVAWAYGAAVVAAFVFFYPIYSAVPLTPSQFESRLWVTTWR